MNASYETQIVLPMGGNNTGIEVPAEVLAELGPSKKPRVRVTLNGDYSFETTVASRGEKYLIAFSKARRDETGLQAGVT
ncbi:DUF1905 domain-containing protein [Arsenicicoccus piscis]|uniref:DUF1905 domain-containing protein n=1 Tax=Arsenicicoccus piscis TaxID=673954 RepID=UPI001F4CC554|nr:DUF1905 domain-containing protein [Arsenicicoccus piscis]MCH8627496.1 DUF1905 domain-containing protein [Arsenicicoccus piscis]